MSIIKILGKAVIIVLFMDLSIHASAQGSWTANWIWNSTQKNNNWQAFRKTVTLSGKPSSAITKIAAENKYWLYVNGQLVVRDGGLDARPSLNNTYYDEVDLAPYLQSGDNVIAALIWYRGGQNGYTQRSFDQGGFLFQSDLIASSPAIIVSDNSWKVIEHPSFETGTFNYKYNISGSITFSNAAFGDPLPNSAKDGYYRAAGTNEPWTWAAAEDGSFTLPGVCDVRFGSENNQMKPAGDVKWIAWPVNFNAQSDIPDWNTLTFNDASWDNAVNKGVPPVAPWNSLIPRTIPFWKDYGLLPYLNQASIPASINSNTTVTGDLGTNIQGTPYLHVNAPAGVRIRIILNDFYLQEYITKAGDQEFECYAWQNSSSHNVKYEFNNVTGPISILGLKFRQTGYNSEIVGSFSCNDNALNSLWTKCKNTSYVCMRDIFFDCPNRERGQWWGDVSEQILYSFYLYDEQSNLLAKKAFRELLNMQKTDGSLYTTAPGTAFHLPDQNIAAVTMLWPYYLYTGDQSLLQELYPQTKKFVQYCASTANNDGMLILQPEQGWNLWNWIDWGNNKDVVSGSANTVVNASYIVLLENVIKTANLLGQSADVTYYQSLISKVKNNFNNYFWNSSSNAYRFHNKNGQQSSVVDDRSNAWAVLAGMVDEAKKAGVFNVLKTKNDASPYQEMYIEMAMSKLDSRETLIRMKKRYAEMINSWSSTLWEEFPASNSNNHAWSAGPLYHLSAFALGIRPTEAGYDEYVYEPQVTNLTEISAVIPTVKGNITASYLKNGTLLFTQNLVSPSNTKVVLGVPKNIFGGGFPVKEIKVNGIVIWRIGKNIGRVSGAAYHSEDSQYIKFTLQPGSWIISSSSQTTGSNDPISLFSNCNYEGLEVGLTTGDYTLSQLLFLGASDNEISSIKIPNGVIVTVYEDDNFGGASIELTSSTPCLSDVGWDNKITSLKVSGGVITDVCEVQPVKFQVQSSPNPFERSATISVTVPDVGYTEISVFSALGSKITSLHEGRLPPGHYEFEFNAEKMLPDLYIYSVIYNNQHLTGKLVKR